LFEEGDYEVALDYQLHYDKPFVFGSTTTKTLTYRIFFKFKVRNGDISAFLRDVDTNQFITNANVAEHGFYIDVANSQYLTMSIKREILTDSLDGLVEDTKFSGVAKEGRSYTEEGIYTVTIKNLATGDSVIKRVYVGNRDILLAHMKTGMSISAINEKLATGATIDASGQIIEPEPPQETTVETPTEPEESSEPLETTEIPEETTSSDSSPQPSSEPETTSNPITPNTSATAEPNQPEDEQTHKNINVPVITAVAAVAITSAGFAVKKKLRKRDKASN
jgi:hypothetical protein